MHADPDAITAPPRIDPAELRRCLGAFVTGVTVITARDARGRPLGMTANSFNSVSLDPPLVAWSLRTGARTFDDYRAAPRFVVNILSEDQIDVSNQFARPSDDRFAGVATHAGIDDLPLIDGCSAYLECRTEAAYPGGDHVIFLGRVERIVSTGRRPLAFGAGRYMVVHPHHAAVPPADDATAALQAVQRARPVLEELGRETDRTVGLGVWGNFGPTLIWWVEGSRALDVQLRNGTVLPLLGSATGKVFAAHLPRARTARSLEAELALRRAVPGAELGTLDAVDAHLADIRTQGLAWVTEAVIDGVNARGLNGVSAPVFDSGGRLVLALTMMGEPPACTAEDPAVARLAEVARQLSHRLGYRA